ncbi:low affinity iron permease family protein [Pseudomonadota bacterium AL_CKDN230030165-1A_HGKHYDSX7]
MNVPSRKPSAPHDRTQPRSASPHKPSRGPGCHAPPGRGTRGGERSGETSERAEPERASASGSHKHGHIFDRFARTVTRWTGSSVAFSLALAAIVVWCVTGPVFDFSETWQLVVNTGTTIITFLMVFLIQQSQNKDSQAVHLKLDELLLAMRGADDRLVDAEDLDEDELRRLAEHYTRLARHVQGRIARIDTPDDDRPAD